MIIITIKSQVYKFSYIVRTIMALMSSKTFSIFQFDYVLVRREIDSKSDVYIYHVQGLEQ